VILKIERVNECILLATAPFRVLPFTA